MRLVGSPTAAADSKIIPSPCVLFFTQDRRICPPCGQVEDTIVPWLEASGWTVVSLDYSDSLEMWDEFDVKASPTLVVIRNGKEYGRSVGSSFSQFEQVLREACEKP